jgi:hypothetical protein
MKRIGIVGLCAVAALALSAMAASSASAAEYGQCRLLTKNTTPKIKHGVYADPNCHELFKKKTTVVAKGNYEWYPGAPANCIKMKKGEYTDEACATKSVKAKKGSFEKQACAPNCAAFAGSGTAPELKGPGPAIKCATYTAAGVITGTTTSISVTTFKGCEVGPPFSTACTTPTGFRGSPEVSGEIVTFPTEATVFVSGGELLEKLENASGPGAPQLADFVCGSEGANSVKGHVAGIRKGTDTTEMSTEGVTENAEGKGEQALVSNLGCTGYTGTEATTCAFKEAASIQVNTTTNTYAAPGEIRP